MEIVIYCKQDIVQNVTGRSTHRVREKEVYSIRRKCGTMRRCGSSAALCVIYQSLSAICLTSFKTFYLYRTLSGMGGFFSKENYPKGTSSLFNNDCSDDGFLDARSYV